MLRKILFLIALLATEIVVSAQKPSFSWSADYKCSKRSPSPLTIGVNEDVLVNLAANRPGNLSKYRIEVFNLNKLHKEPRIIDLGKTLPRCSGHYIEQCFFVDRVIYIISRDKEEIYGSMIDQKGRVISQGQKMMSLGRHKSARDISVTYTLSSDTTRILALYNYNEDKDGKANIYYRVFDLDELQLVADEHTELKYRQRDIKRLKYLLDTNNNIYILGTRIAEGRKFWDEQSRFLLLYYNAEFNRAYEIDDFMPANSHSISNYYGLKGMINAENKLIIASLYGSESLVYGLMYVRVNGRNTELTRLNDFSHDVIKKMNCGLNRKEAASLKGISSSFEIDRMLESPDQQLYVFIEYQMVESNSMTTRAGTTTTYTYYNDDLLICKMDSEGAIARSYPINKRQKMTIPGSYSPNFGLFLGLFYSNLELFNINTSQPHMKYLNLLSYYPVFIDNELVVVFNDHVKNINTSDTRDLKYFKNFRKSACVMVSLADQKLKKQMLFHNNESKYMISPGNSVLLSNGQFITMGMSLSLKRLRVGLIKLPEAPM